MFCICDAEEEQQSDAEDTSVNESSSLETIPSSSLESIPAVEAQPAAVVKSPVVESKEPPAPKIASPVQQVILCLAYCTGG